jgi:hypothetical protein
MSELPMVRDAPLRDAPHHEEEQAAIFLAALATNPSLILRSHAKRGVSKDGRQARPQQ